MKQVIIVRNDVGMSPGKMVSQACHAVSLFWHEYTPNMNSWYNPWFAAGEKKVILQGTLDEMDRVNEAAKPLKLVRKTVWDAGKTEVAAGTFTCLLIGPADEKVIDKITGHLKLL